MHSAIFLFHWPVVCLYLATYFLFHWIILCACLVSCLIWFNFHRRCPWLLGRGESDCVIVSSWLQGTSLYFPFVFIWANFRLEPWGHYSWLFCWRRNIAVEVARTKMIQVGSIPDICAQPSSPFPGWVSRKPSFPLPVIHNQRTADPEPIRNNTV